MMNLPETLKLVAVDDDPSLDLIFRHRYRELIASGNLAYDFTDSGHEVIRRIQEYNDIDIVLTDISMPKMDGLTLLEQIKENNPLVRTIVMSAYGDMDNIRGAMNRGALDFITKPINYENLETTLEKAFKEVLEQRKTLKTIKENDILKLYVDQDVIRFMFRNEQRDSLLSNEKIEATVAFFDICGYTDLTEKHPPDTVISILNHYFDITVREIEQKEGQVDKFIGDCVMAVFRGGDHLDRALEAALTVRSVFKEKSETEPDEYLPDISIGINTGEMLSGNIGSESLKRLDYTVIGDVVNSAQRFQSAAEAGQIIVSEKIYHLKGEAYRWEELGELKLKNKEEPERLYNVIAEAE